MPSNTRQGRRTRANTIRAVLIDSITEHVEQDPFLTVKIILTGNADVQNLFDVEVSSNVGGGELKQDYPKKLAST